MGITRKQAAMVVILLFGGIVAVLNQSAMSPALPAIMADTGTTETQVQWLTSGYSLVEAVTIPLSAFLLGRFRTNRLFAGALGLFCAGSVIGAVAPSFGLLMCGRVLQAVGTGVVLPMTTTLVMLIFPTEKRGSAMGLVMLCVGFAPAIGPTVSGLLVDSVGWHSLFAVMAVISAVVALCGWKWITSFDDFERAPLDVPSVCLSTLGLLCLLFGLSTFTTSENVAVPVVLALAGAATVALFARRQMRLEAPILNVRVLKARRFRTAVLTMMVLQAALMGFTVLMPLYLQNVLGASATTSGLVMLPGAICGALSALAAGVLFDRVGVRPLAVTGAAVMAAAGVCSCLFASDSPVVMVAVAYTLMFIAMQFTMSPMNTWGINSLDNALIQHGNALSNTLNQVGGSFGTALIVSMTALAGTLYPDAQGAMLQFEGYHIGFIAAAVIIFAVLVCVVAFARNRKGDAVLSLKEAKEPEPEGHEVTDEEAACEEGVL